MITKTATGSAMKVLDCIWIVFPWQYQAPENKKRVTEIALPLRIKNWK